MGEAHELIREIESLARSIAGKQGMLERIQANCRHTFTQPKYDPIIHKGYSIPPRTPRNYDDFMDAQGVIVPDKVEDRWTRVCTLCGKVEHTIKVDVHTETTKTPKFGSM